MTAVSHIIYVFMRRTTLITTSTTTKAHHPSTHLEYTETIIIPSGLGAGAHNIDK